MRKVMVLVLLLVSLVISPNFSFAASCNPIRQSDINNGPFVITVPGDYCLKEDIHVDYSWKNRYGFKVIDIKTRDVTINLNGKSIINDDGSNHIRSDYSNQLHAINARGPQNGIPFVGTEFTIKNGRIEGFDFGIMDTALRRTKKFLVDNVYFDNVYIAVWARPVKALIENNYFVNNIPFTSTTVAISLQNTDFSNIKNNIFKNHHTTIDLFSAKSVEVSYNYIKSPGVSLPIVPRGITITNVNDANVYKNNLNDLYIGVMANLQSSVSIIKNKGCRLTNPVYVNSPARVGEVGNVWNNC
jgi:hypothetical protein